VSGQEPEVEVEPIAAVEPEPTPVVEPEPDPIAAAAEPTPVVAPEDATWSQPAGSALLDGAPVGPPVDPNPEKRVGAAFAGGLVAALLIKQLAKRRHR
jgi:hypothetical protein